MIIIYIILIISLIIIIIIINQNRYHHHHHHRPSYYHHQLSLSVDVATKVFKKYLPKYTRFGPSIVGLSIIPLLPMYLDHPVEHALEKAFQKYGPWAIKEKKE